ncbi:Uncharacterised protein [uncultured archaeon]|nr:Uncharacterised protein [uncultured archaeon]
MKEMVFVAAIALAVLAAGCTMGPGSGDASPTPTGMVGNDSDAHGCRASAGYSWCEVKNRCIRPWEENCSAQMTGNDMDAHGCIASAGYSWCPEKNKCLRSWEELCNSTTLDAMAASYCNDESVSAVYACGDYIRVVSATPGAGSTIYRNGETIRCPLVSPDSMTDECRQYVLGSNCAEANRCPAAVPGAPVDVHGCRPAAGYAWCEFKAKCIRTWEEECGPGVEPCLTVTDCGVGAAACVNGTCTQYDEHGCVPDGGYSWCEAKNKCIRPWEENCTAG